MKLLDYMRAEKLDDDAVARLVGGITGHGVKKWKYGERKPRADQIARLVEVTKGKVGLHDFVEARPSDQETAA